MVSPNLKRQRGRTQAQSSPPALWLASCMAWDRSLGLLLRVESRCAESF